MAKNVTTWSNNDTKSSESWAKVARNSSQWTNNITKATARVTVTSRNRSQWGILEQTAQTYLYDLSYVPYDSSLFEYNYIVDNNTVNSRLQTVWAESEQ